MKYLFNFIGAACVSLLIIGLFFAPFLLLAYVFFVTGFMN